MQNKLSVESTIAIGNSSGTTTNFKVVGIVGEPAGDNPSDVYIPLAVAQKLANMKNDANTIYVAASNSSAIGTVSSEIKQALPSDTVTTSSDLASEVTGSLANAPPSGQPPHLPASASYYSAQADHTSGIPGFSQTPDSWHEAQP